MRPEIKIQKGIDKYIYTCYNVHIGYIQYVRFMYMNIFISNSSNEPIYEQIVRQIKALVMSGELAEGDALPSMRLLAQQLRISVITTKRAYEELERDGFIESYTGKGSFVRRQNPELFREETLRQIEAGLSEVCSIAKTADVSLSELIDILTMLYSEQ